MGFKFTFKSCKMSHQPNYNALTKAMALQPFFDPWYFQYTKDPLEKELQGIEKICKSYRLETKYLVLIFQLIKWRVERPEDVYDLKEQYFDEVETLFNLLQHKIPPPDISSCPIKRIALDLHGKKPIVFSNSLLLGNLLLHAWPYLSQFLKHEYEEYIKPNYVPRTERKRSGAKKGKDRENRKLAKQIITYLENRTELQQKEIGDIVLDLFRIANSPLKFKGGRNLYRTLITPRATRKGNK